MANKIVMRTVMIQRIIVMMLLVVTVAHVASVQPENRHTDEYAEAFVRSMASNNVVYENDQVHMYARWLN